MVHKVIQTRYYWPTMLKDAQAYDKAYDKCQRFSDQAAFRGTNAHDGPFPTALRLLKFLVVGIDYFTK